MERPEQIRELFEGSFAPPPSTVELSEAEKKLGHELPPILKQHYGFYDGFHGPTGAWFFYSLSKLVETTIFLRSESYFPEFLKRAVALGDYGVGPYWLIELERPEIIIEWDAEMEGEERILLEESLTDIWLGRKTWYEDVS